MNALDNPMFAGALGALIVLLGALLVSLPYLIRHYPAIPPNTRLGRLEARWARLRQAIDSKLSSFVLRLSSWLHIKFRYPELGGYVHDTSMTQFIPPTLMHGATATWTQIAGQTANTIVLHGDATDETALLTIPVMIPSNGVAQKGAYLTAVDVDFEVLVAACDAVDALVHLVTRGADTADATVAAQAFTYDTGHDTAAERDDLDEHRMTLTLDTPIWIDEDQYVLVQIAFDKAATTTIDMLGAFARYTLRL